MKCIDSKCNSIGIWPSKLLIDISKFEEKSEEEKLGCELKFILNRGWTPYQGEFKSFIYKIEYELKVELLSLHS